MADNVGYTPGSGATIAADDVGGALVQRVKVTFGGDGVATDVDTGAPLPVELQGTPEVTVSGTVAVSGPLTDEQLRASAVPVTIAGNMTTSIPDNEASGLPVRQVGEQIWTCSFADVGASVLSSDFTLLRAGTGIGYSQASGSLAVTTGTSTNAEFVARSVASWRGALRLRASTVLSQRIANNNFAVLLADSIGDALTYTINSTTSVSVTKTAHGYTSANVGQFMMLGAITGAAGVPGRYAIASIPDADTINFTVASWPASGTGTLYLFGHSYIRVLYTGTTATQAAVDAQRKGWATGDTTATINTSASPGHIVQAEVTGRDVFFADALRATATSPNFTTRASRYENIPDDNLPLYLYLWSYNGTTAPASTTTWTFGFASVEKFANTPVYVQGFRAQGTINALPVAQQGNITIGTNAALVAGTAAIGDVGVQYRANATGAASLVSVMAPATPAATAIKASAGRLLGYSLTNNSAAVKSVKIWNTAVAGITLGTTAALFEIDIPANAHMQKDIPGGIGFATAITYAVTGAVGLTNNTAISANDVTGYFYYA